MALRSMTVHRYEEIRRRLAEGRSLHENARALGCSEAASAVRRPDQGAWIISLPSIQQAFADEHRFLFRVIGP